jgi:hypothetical protein
MLQRDWHMLAPPYMCVCIHVNIYRSISRCPGYISIYMCVCKYISVYIQVSWLLYHWYIFTCIHTHMYIYSLYPGVLAISVCIRVWLTSALRQHICTHVSLNMSHVTFNTYIVHTYTCRYYVHIYIYIYRRDWHLLARAHLYTHTLHIHQSMHGYISIYIRRMHISVYMLYMPIYRRMYVSVDIEISVCLHTGVLYIDISCRLIYTTRKY